MFLRILQVGKTTMTMLKFAVAHLPTFIRLLQTGVPLLIDLYQVMTTRDTISRDELLEKLGAKKDAANARAEAKAEEIKARKKD